MKKFILILLMLIVFTLTACGSKNETSFDRNNPSPIIVTIEGDLKEITVVGVNVNDKVTEFEDIIKNGNVVLGSLFFSKYENGKYEITVKADNKVVLTVNLEGNDYNYTYTKKADVFKKNEKRYYVLFSRSGCSGCAQLSPDLIVFNNFLQEYPKGMVSSLYVVDYDDPEFETSKGEGTNYTGISTYDELINNVSISTPTLMVIENGAVQDYYIGASNISSYFYIEMDNIKNNCIIHNVDDAKTIKIALDFTPTHFRLYEEDNTSYNYKVSEYTEGNTGFDGSDMIFGQYYFNSFLPGNYRLEFYNSEGNSKEVQLIIKSTFRYITVDTMFDQEEEAYYVFFLRDGCSGCNAVKPTLLKYSNYYDIYDNGENYPIYAVHRSMNNRFKYFGDPEYFVGAKSYEEIKLGYYPRVVLVKNHEIVEVYKNEGNQILTHFKELMSKIK